MSSTCPEQPPRRNEDYHGLGLQGVWKTDRDVAVSRVSAL